MAELVFELRQQLARVAAEMERTDIRLAVTGGKAVGKTTLIQLLQQQKLPAILSTPSELMNTTATPAVSPESGAVSKLPDNRSADPNRDLDAADLVLFVTTGDLRDSEFRAIEPLIKIYRTNAP
jgi:GTPase SAR1 family protein